MAAQTRLHDAGFFLSVLDSVDQEIAVLDRNGVILFVNDAWVRFGSANGAAQEQWLGTDYLRTCAQAERFDPAGVHHVVASIRAVLEGKHAHFEQEYPCDSPDERRWFMMTLSRLNHLGEWGEWGDAAGRDPASRELFVVTHTNITQRKLMEEKVESLSLQDELTGLANRRNFERFYSAEWHRNHRDRTPISLAMFDLDHFKALNDRYGHLAGDRCIRNAAALIGGHAHRASDLAVRWGGEEFILLMGNTPQAAAFELAEGVRSGMQGARDPEYGRSTLSAGVATMVPRDDDRGALIRMADLALYQAKQQGRNRVALWAEPRPA